MRAVSAQGKACTRRLMHKQLCSSTSGVCSPPDVHTDAQPSVTWVHATNSTLWLHLRAPVQHHYDMGPHRLSCRAGPHTAWQPSSSSHGMWAASPWRTCLRRSSSRTSPVWALHSARQASSLPSHALRLGHHSTAWASQQCQQVRLVTYKCSP